MDKFERIDEIIAGYTASVGELRKEFDVIKRDDLFAENNSLRDKINELTELNIRITEHNGKLTAENKRLRNEMYEQCFNEKTKLVESSAQSLDAYFAASVSGEKNRLSQLEEYIKAHIDNLTKQLEMYRVDLQHEAYSRLQSLRDYVNFELASIRQKNENAEQELLAEKAERLKELKEKPLTEEEISRRGKQNNLEVLLGLKVLNRVGVFLILVGVTAAVQFTYTRVPDIAKGILVYIFGVFILGLGEFFGRKKPNVFSIGITSGGVAILYIATALCFFTLNVIGMYTALLICVLVTTAAFILARRYNSQTVAAFAIIGGYLPLSSIAGNETLIYFAMGYFIILNIFSLFIAGIKKWHVAQFIGFGMHVVATFAVVIQLYDTSQGTAQGVTAVCYMFIAFLIYNFIPILSSYRSKTKLLIPDNVMLIINTILGSCGMFGVLWMFGFWSKAGLASVFIAVFYFGVAWLIDSKMPKEKSCHILFYITGLMFAVLVIPLQFGVAYLSLGWLIEGVLLLCYGILAENRTFKISGWIICGICLFAFIFADILTYGDMFFYKYLFITLGSLIILGAILYKKQPHNESGGVFKCVSIVNLWFFLLYTTFAKIEPALWSITPDYGLSEHIAFVFVVILSIAFAYFIARFKPVTDKPVRIISIVIDIISILILIFINRDGYLYYIEIPIGLKIFGTAIIVIVNLLAIFGVYDVVTRLALGRGVGIEWVPIIVSAFFVFLLMQNLVILLDLSLNNIILTGILAATALGWIVFGFARRYHYIRLCGLVLSFVTTAKLFVFDLGYLSTGLRIVSYFMMGVAFLSISFVYQYFRKKLELRSGGDESDEA